MSRKPALTNGFRGMERAGIEPATSGLQSRAEGNDTRRRTTTIGRNHAGFGCPPLPGPAWLCQRIPGRLWHECGTGVDSSTVMGGVATWYEDRDCLSDKCRGLRRRHKITTMSTGSGEVIAGPSVKCMWCGWETGIRTIEPKLESAPDE